MEKQLDRFNEQWFSRKAYELLGERLSRPPAPLYEGVRFAVKDMMHHKCVRVGDDTFGDRWMMIDVAADVVCVVF